MYKNIHNQWTMIVILFLVFPHTNIISSQEHSNDQSKPIISQFYNQVKEATHRHHGHIISNIDPYGNQCELHKNQQGKTVQYVLLAQNGSECYQFNHNNFMGIPIEDTRKNNPNLHILDEDKADKQKDNFTKTIRLNPNKIKELELLFKTNGTIINNNFENGKLKNRLITYPNQDKIVEFYNKEGLHYHTRFYSQGSNLQSIEKSLDAAGHTITKHFDYTPEGKLVDMYTILPNTDTVLEKYDNHGQLLYTKKAFNDEKSHLKNHVQTTHFQNNKRTSFVIETLAGQKVSERKYNTDGSSMQLIYNSNMTINKIGQFNAQNQIIESSIYDEHGTKRETVICDPETNTIIKTTIYDANGNVIES